MGMTSSLSFTGFTGVYVYDLCLVLRGLGGIN